MPVQVFNVQEHFARPTAQLLKLLVAGPAGAGKTRFASTFPHPLYADAEGLLMSVRDRPVRAVTISTVRDLEDLRNELDQHPDIRAKRLGGPVETVVLDTVDHIARLMMDERKKAEKRDAFTQADWGLHGDRLRDLLRSYRNLEMNVIFNVHVKEDRDEEIGRILINPRVQGAVGGELADYVNESLLLCRRTTTDPKTGERMPVRYLQTFADSGVSWLKDHSGALPMEFPIDFQTDYERMAKLIFGSMPTPAEPSERVVEAIDWQPDREVELDQQRVDELAGQMRKSMVEVGDTILDPAIEQAMKKAPAKKAATKKKAAVTMATSTGPVEQEAPQGDVVTEQSPPPAEAPHPDTAVPEKGTEPAEAPVTEAPAGPPCAVCGDRNINENYLELSEARWGEFLCRTHFLEKNKQR